MATYRHNYVNFGTEALASEWMLKEMLRRAALGAAFAKTIAPRDTGDFADSIEPSAHIRPASGRYTRRAVGAVTANDEAAFQIEHGTQDTPAHRTLGKTLPTMQAG